MRTLLLILFVATLCAQKNPNRLTLDWLVREDIFAGLLENDRARLEKGLETINTFTKAYPEGSVMAWRYAAEVMKAVWAYEGKDMVSFNRHYGVALTYLDLCRKASKGPDADLPEIFEGAVMALTADRLPEAMRKGAWERAYQAYAKLDELQAAELDRLPMHMKGESLSGLAASAYRTGREAEMMKTLERMQVGLTKTPYAAVARKWVEDPGSRGRVKIVCISCHEPNRLGNRVELSHVVK
jgi:hypothetical protein